MPKRRQTHKRLSRPLQRRLLRTEPLERRDLLTIVINEVMTDNGGFLFDGNGNSPDWIELHNTGSETVDLAGWHLTDDSSDLTKWQFPAFTIAANDYLIVLASGDDMLDPAGNHHTNFSLNSAGEYLALTAADGTTIVDEIAPTIPPLPENTSYGQGRFPDHLLITRDSAARLNVPTNDNLGLSWTTPQFDDSGPDWHDTTSSIGYDTLASSELIQQWNFESGSLDGFQVVAGSAFNNQPTYGDNPNARGWPAINLEGDYFVGTYENRPTAQNVAGGIQGDGPQGIIETPSFTIADAARMEFLIGGGNHPWNAAWDPDTVFGTGTFTGITLERQVAEDDWEVLLTATGAATEVMQQVDWDLTAFAGETARLRIYDLNSGGWGHPNLDNIRYYGIDRPFTTDIHPILQQQNSTVLVRIPFEVPDVVNYDLLSLDISYDDGFVAYLNGQEVARRNAPDPTLWNSVALTEENSAENISLNSFLQTLTVGTENVLAIQLLNTAADDSDLQLETELTYGSSAVRPRFFTEPTASSENGVGVAGFVDDTNFSVDRGFYTQPFTVEITTATTNAEVWYTTDGSEPSPQNGIVYTQPIQIDSTTNLRAAAYLADYAASNVDTQTYVFLDDVLRQPAQPAGFPATWNNYTIGPTSTLVPADYEMNPAVVAEHASTLHDDLLAIPTLSIATDRDNLFDSATGIYTNPFLGGEQAVSLEWFSEDDSQGFQVNAGLRLLGGWSRHFWATPKKSFAVRFRRDYDGPPKLDFPFFTENQADSTVPGTDSFETLALKAVFSDAWPDAASPPQYLRDMFTRYSQLAMGQHSSHGTWAHVYLNGLYWGIYNVSERPDGDFGAAYFGGDNSDYDAIKHAGLCGPGCATNNQYEVLDGDNIAWQQALNLAAGGLADAVRYAQFEELVDTENLADYILLNHYMSNVDWPHKNWYAMRKRENGAGFRFFAWDSEYTLNAVDANRLNVNNANTPAALFAAARQNADFRRLFGDRVHQHLFNDGPLTPTANQQRYSELAAHIDGPIRGELARWGDNGATRQGATNFSYEGDWLATRDYILDNFFPARHDVALAHIRNASLYPDLAAPSFSQHGGVVPTGYELTMAAPAGTIYYTTDGTDPLQGNAVSPTAVEYVAPLTLDSSASIQARTHDGMNWSALNSATFVVDVIEPLRITELMYNPVAGDESEFLEVTNTGVEPLQLAGYTIQGGVSFTFPDLELAAGESTVVVRDEPAFRAVYGQAVSVAGVFSGGLSNAGEELVLADDFGQAILSLEYRDDWYPITDGGGFSLVVVDPQASVADWSSRAQWRPSGLPNGSPNQIDPTNWPLPGALVINEILAHSDEPRGDWVELHNTTDEPIDLQYWYLSDDANDYQRHQIVDSIIVPARGYVTLDEQMEFGPLVDPVNGFALSELGDDFSLTAGLSDGSLGGFQAHVEFGASENGVSFGNYTTSDNRVDFVSLAELTPSATNAPPAVGPLSISEIMYHPATDGSEFLELTNVTNAPLPLYDLAHPTNRWSLRGGVDFEFPQLEVPAQARLLVVPTDPEQFRQDHNLPAATLILGPYTRSLSNGGETLRLFKPGTPEPDGTIPQILVEAIRYRDTAPWPVEADGLGGSLERISAAEYGNDPINWMLGSFGGSPGQPNVGRDTTPPSTPQWTSVDVVGANSIQLSWTAADDAESSVLSYNVYRDGNLLTTVLAPELTWFDENYQQGAPREYRISAVNGDGIEGAMSPARVISTLQDGIGPTLDYAGTDDTHVVQSQPTINFGSQVVLEATTDAPAGTDQDSIVLIRWDTSDVAPDTYLHSATIQLALNAATTTQYEIYAATRPWVEGEATWQEFAAGQPWQAAGVAGTEDRGDIVLGSVRPSASGYHTITLNTDGRSVVQQWIDGSSDNQGLVLVPGPPAVGGPADVLEHLIAFYDFETGANGTAIDHSGNNLHGTISNASLDTGFDGQGFRFNGNGHVVAPIDINPDQRPRFTMGAWVRSDQVASGLYKILGHDNGGWDRTVGLDNRGAGGFRWTAFIGNGPPIPNTTAPVFQQWSFVAAAYDQAANEVTLYVDIDANSINDDLAAFTNATNFNPGQTTVAIGNIRPDNFNEGFRGVMDNIFFFDEFLSAEQLTEIRDLGQAYFLSAPGTEIHSSESPLPALRPRLDLVTSPHFEVADWSVHSQAVDPPNLDGGAQPTSWTNQRSDLREMTILFSDTVVASASDLQLINLGVDADQDEDEEILLRDEQVTISGNSIRLTFEPYELPDGVYSLVLTDGITSSWGIALDGDQNGSAGGDFVVVGSLANGLSKLQADWNGDNGVSIFDFATFSYWFGSAVPLAPAYVDLNGDNGVSIFDFAFFADQFGRGLIFPAAPVAREWSAPSQASRVLLESHATDEGVLQQAATFPERPQTTIEKEPRTRSRQTPLEQLLEELFAEQSWLEN